jgi:urea transport system permease protein
MKPNSFRWCCRVIMGFILMLPTMSIGQEGASEDAFSSALANLKAASMQERGLAIEQLATVQKPQAIVVLQALLDGRLFSA